MSSAVRPDAGWSLTRRLSWIFSLTTCVLLGVHTLGACYFVFDTLRDEIGLLIEHESNEFLMAVEASDRSQGAAQEIVTALAETVDDIDMGFRVRRATGEVLASAGEPELFEGDWRLVAVGARAPRNPFSWDRLATQGTTADGRMHVDFVLDGSRQQRRLREFVAVATIGFLVMAGLSGLAGWFVATRGLRWLSDVVTQSRRIDFPGGAASIRLDGAPDEMRDLVLALNAMLERIDRRLREMRTFTAGLAHELRSPLQNLIGETEVALMAERPREEYERLLRSNLEELQDLASAVGNIVTFCRTSEPRLREHVAQLFDAREEIALVLSGWSRHAERAGIVFDLSTAGGTTWVGDRESYRRVVRNLVDNAASWSPPGGRVAIALGIGAEGLRLVVDDEGPGVPDALRERIFDPFVTTRPRDGRRGGYGLGLTICRTLVEEAGGSIRHEAREPRGARFVVELPRTLVAASA